MGCVVGASSWEGPETFTHKLATWPRGERESPLLEKFAAACARCKFHAKATAACEWSQEREGKLSLSSDSSSPVQGHTCVRV